MSRMTQFKDKSAKEQSITVGLFNYPILMAADILLYDAKYVPVGDDQTQHLEFARDIALRFNARFNKNIFIVPEEVEKQHAFFNKDQGLRIKDLVDPTKKMSKSDASDKGIIFIDDDPSVARKKILSATTDNLANINYDTKNQPGISNLLELYSLLNKQPLGEVIEEWKGKTSYKDIKEAVADRIEEFLKDIQEKYRKVDESKLMNKLLTSEKELNQIANMKLSDVQKAVGLRE